MRRGEIWWAELPEPLGRRPVVLVSRAEAYDVRQNVVVIEVTTTVRGLATEVSVGRREGLARRCVANADGIHTVPKRCLSERAGRMNGERLERLDEALRFALGLDG